jgi:hypothetical protein
MEVIAACLCFYEFLILSSIICCGFFTWYLSGAETESPEGGILPAPGVSPGYAARKHESAPPGACARTHDGWQLLRAVSLKPYGTSACTKKRMAPLPGTSPGPGNTSQPRQGRVHERTTAGSSFASFP